MLFPFEPEFVEVQAAQLGEALDQAQKAVHQAIIPLGLVQARVLVLHVVVDLRIIG